MRSDDGGDGMNTLIKLLIIALACPLVLPIVIEAEAIEAEREGENARIND